MPDALEEFRRQRRSVFYPKADLFLPAEAFRRDPSAAPFLSCREVADLCARSLRQPIGQVTPLKERGTFHDLWRVETASGSRVVFRANAIPRYCADFPLLLDRAIGERLKSQGIPAATVLAVDVSRRYCSTDYAVLEEARGSPLKHWDGDEERMLVLSRRLGCFLGRVHGVRVEGYGLLDGGERLRGCHTSWTDYLRRHLDRHIRYCETLAVISESEGERIRAIFDEHESCFENAPSALLHGDPGSHNVFVDGGDVTCMIDWEDALAGDPVYDVAFWATFQPERRHASFLAGYRSVAGLPGDFELRFRLYFLRVSLAKAVVRDRLGLTDVPGREPASARIHKALRCIERRCLWPS